MNGALPLLGVLWALTLIGLGGVAVRDVLVDIGVISGRRYVDETLTYLDNRTSADWMVAAGIAAALVGLWLVTLALRPRRRKELSVKAQTGVFLTTASVRRIAQAASSDVDGIDTSSVAASRSKVTIDVTTLTADPAEARSRVEEAVQRALSALIKPPTVNVNVRSTGGSP
ncbi:MAG: DUF6286 domain-containing protein [Nocardioidaceae bacterium]